MESLPPVGDDSLNAQEFCGSEGACTIEEYAKWWARGEKLHAYLEDLPVALTKAHSMDGLQKSLLQQWTHDVTPPSSLGKTVSKTVLGRLLLWVRQTETLIYYVTYRDKQVEPGPTTPGRLEVIDEPNMQSWHWPWIKGWHDPNQRSLILNPKQPSKWSPKKILLYGGVGVAGLYIAKKVFTE
jgi:hypothetical protein